MKTQHPYLLNVRKFDNFSDMTVMNSIHAWLSDRKEGFIFCNRELLGLGSRASIDKCLSRLCFSGKIERLSRGLYGVRSSNIEESKQDIVKNAVSAIARARRLPIQINGEASFKKLGILNHDESIQFCNVSEIGKNFEFWWAGNTKTLEINGFHIRIRKVNGRKLAFSSNNAGLVISSVWSLGKDRLTDSIAKDIIKILSEEERNQLRDNIEIMPSWASDIFIKAFQESNGVCQSEQNTTNDSNNGKNTPYKDDQEKKWTSSTVEGRWSGFGPYYAMFPVDFARKVISKYCPEGGSVLDPFCGRGTVPFVALATGRYSIGCDINPVAWVYAKVKTEPHPNPKQLIDRAEEIQRMVCRENMISENEFQKYAWAPEVLGFLNIARRELDWKNCNIDRSLMGTLLVHLHAKLGDGLSNQLRQSKAMAPDYSVRWWKSNGMLPPSIDVVSFISKKLDWRYKHGTVRASNNIEKPMILLGDNRKLLSELENGFQADLILTSPPYYGITNYRYDNWMRLWLLGEGSALPDNDSWARHGDKSEYIKLLKETFENCRLKSKDHAIIYVRTDARKFTLETTIRILKETWPEKNLFYSHDAFKKATQTALFGDKSKKPGEFDLVMLPQGQNPQDEMDLLNDGEVPSL